MRFSGASLFISAALKPLVLDAFSDAVTNTILPNVVGVLPEIAFVATFNISTARISMKYTKSGTVKS